MVGEACLPSNAYYPRTPDYTLYSGVHVCWSEYSESLLWIYEFGLRLSTMTAPTLNLAIHHKDIHSTVEYIGNFLTE